MDSTQDSLCKSVVPSCRAAHWVGAVRLPPPVSRHQEGTVGGLGLGLAGHQTALELADSPTPEPGEPLGRSA